MKDMVGKTSDRDKHVSTVLLALRCLEALDKREEAADAMTLVRKQAEEVLSDSGFDTILSWCSQD